MDLNARPTRNFWDIFHCCRNIGEGENDENPTKFSATNNYAFMKFLDTKGTDMMNPSAADSVDTPTTVATAGELYSCIRCGGTKFRIITLLARCIDSIVALFFSQL
jgi:hypothetical protein